MNKLTLAAGPMMASLLIILSGCGGSGNSGTSSARGLSLKTSDGYNGIAKSITEGAVTSVTGGQFTATINQNGRKLFLTIPDVAPTEGESFIVGTPDVVARYEEDPLTRGLNAYKWKASNGGVVVTRLGTDGKATLVLNNLTFGPNPDVDSNAAAGTFKLSGSLNNVQFATVAPTGGTNVTFTVFPGDDGDAILTKFPRNSDVQFGASTTPNRSILIVDTVTGLTPRRLVFLLDDSVVAGSTIDYSIEENQGLAGYSQSFDGGDEDQWIAISGTLTVVARTSTTVTVSLANVRFQAAGPDFFGSFLVNGTITK